VRTDLTAASAGSAHASTQHLATSEISSIKYCNSDFHLTVQTVIMGVCLSDRLQTVSHPALALAHCSSHNKEGSFLQQAENFVKVLHQTCEAAHDAKRPQQLSNNNNCVYEDPLKNLLPFIEKP
jgi:hypothetical protein